MITFVCRCRETFPDLRGFEKHQVDAHEKRVKGIARQALIDAMEPVDGRTPSNKEIGAFFDVSHQAIEQQLARKGLHKPRTRKVWSKDHYCPSCGRFDFLPNVRCYKCQPVELHQITCGECGKVFPLTFSEYNARMRDKRSLREGPRVWPLFCGRPCFGRYLSQHRRPRGKKKRNHHAVLVPLIERRPE